MVGQDVLSAIARLNNDEDFRVFVDELRRRKEAARDTLQQVTDQVLIGRAQGTAEAMGELIDLTQSARAAIARRQGR